MSVLEFSQMLFSVISWSSSFFFSFRLSVWRIILIFKFWTNLSPFHQTWSCCVVQFYIFGLICWAFFGRGYCQGIHLGYWSITYKIKKCFILVWYQVIAGLIKWIGKWFFSFLGEIYRICIMFSLNDLGFASKILNKGLSFLK